jgi:3-oxoacyl-[acyl-carrier-protein] synthase-3
MHINFQITGTGYAVGSQVVSNSDLAVSLGLKSDWFEKRTGIHHRRVCDASENVMRLAVSAVQNACNNAGLKPTELGHETVVLHIQNGLTYLTPPSGILLCNELQMLNVRTLTIDGVCSEPINAIEIAALMLNYGTCERAIISTSVDFLDVVNPNDLGTVGLFGAGAGALIMEKNSLEGTSGLRGIYWENQSKYWNLGIIPLLESASEKDGVRVLVGHYQMKGTALARVAYASVGRAVDEVFKQSGWTLNDLDCVVTHQPNAKMLELGLRKLNIDLKLVELPVYEFGNMGPASLLVSLALAHERGRIAKGGKLLLISFGLGFSCGVAAIEF